jgi:hypothetical protein
MCVHRPENKLSNVVLIYLLLFALHACIRFHAIFRQISTSSIYVVFPLCVGFSHLVPEVIKLRQLA